MEFLVSWEGPFPRAGHLGRGPHGLPRAMLASVLLQSCSQAPFSCFHVVLVIFPFSLSSQETALPVWYKFVLFHFLLSTALSHQPPVSWYRMERGCEPMLWWWGWEGPGAFRFVYVKTGKLKCWQGEIFQISLSRSVTVHNLDINWWNSGKLSV